LVEQGHSEVCGSGFPLERRVDLGDLVLRAGQADLQPLDFPEPSFALGFSGIRQSVV
jgi:hypothetical protein